MAKAIHFSYNYVKDKILTLVRIHVSTKTTVRRVSVSSNKQNKTFEKNIYPAKSMQYIMSKVIVMVSISNFNFVVFCDLELVKKTRNRRCRKKSYSENKMKFSQQFDVWNKQIKIKTDLFREKKGCEI